MSYTTLLNFLNDPSGQGDCVNFHQPEWTASETAEDETLQPSEAAHSVEWAA